MRNLLLRFLVLTLSILLSACNNIKPQSEVEGHSHIPNLLISNTKPLATIDNTDNTDNKTVSTSIPTQPTFEPKAETTTDADTAETTKTANTKISNTADLWDRVRAQYQLDLSMNEKRIDSQLKWFTRHQSYLDRVTERASRYMYFIMEQIEVRDIPGELALLPIVESAFDPFAYSHGRASGVWQFIPSTGRIYNLKQDWWYDGRRDIRKSTIAALKFLKGLSREFKGDWMLALAAYNSGAGTVRKAIRKNKRKGLPTDFWALSLPKETRAYAPKLIALAKLIKEPEKYGITLPKINDEPYFAVVDTQAQIDLSQAAQLAEVDLEEIYKLNPQYNQWATSPSGPHEILIPVQKKAIFESNLSKLPKGQRIKWQRYKIKPGDSLISIAKKYHTTPEALKQVNPIRKNLLRAGDMLLIPTAFKSAKSYTYSAVNRLNKKQSSIRGSKGSTKLKHTVQSGDSFWSLAKKHNVSVGKIASWNGMAPKDPLRAGQKLVIWSNSITPDNNREVIRKIRYRVRNGDSLHRIADKFNVLVKDIKRWNQIGKKKYLQPGDELILYVDVTQAS